MKKILSLFLIILIMFIGINVNAKEEKINVYLFYGKTCPVCAEERKFLDNLSKQENINIVTKEVWYNEENELYLNKILDVLEDNTTSVPITIIGETMINGYSDAIANKIKRSISYYSNNEYIDMVKEIEKGTYIKKETIEDFLQEEKEIDEDLTITLPIIKQINLKNLQTSNAIFLLGLINSINPSLIMTLIMLISIFINVKSKRKAAIYGIIYIFICNMIYLLVKNLNIYSIYPSIISIIVGLILICYEILSKKQEKETNKSYKIIQSILFIFLLLGTISFILIDKTVYYNYFVKILNIYKINNLTRIFYYILYFISYIAFDIFLYLMIIYNAINRKEIITKEKINTINYALIIIVCLLLIFNVN